MRKEEFRIVDPVLPEPREFLKYYEMSQKDRHYSNNGPCVRLLEKRFGKLLDNEVVTCNNATSGLTAAIAAINLEFGGNSYVGMSDFTYVATACAIDAAGFTVLTYDINEEYALDLSTYPKNVPPPIIVITCPFGSIPVETIKKYSKNTMFRQPKIIVDAAASLGLPWKDLSKLVEEVDAVVFSLHATKTFGIGEGGLIATKRATTAKYARDYLSFNLGLRNGQNVVMSGMNGKMPELMAAVALAKLDRFEGDNNRRIEKALDYIVEVMVDGLELYPFEHTYQVVPFRVERNKDLEGLLSANGIPFRKYYEAPMGVFQQEKSALAHKHNVCLPFSEKMSRKQIDSVRKVLETFENKKGNEKNSVHPSRWN
jgi:dTDP-4-amino-4,6-dideoxygalactose transaminase